VPVASDPATRSISGQLSRMRLRLIRERATAFRGP
jgi:hypothetical protein